MTRDARGAGQRKRWRRYTPAMRRVLAMPSPPLATRKRSNLEHVVAKTLSVLGVEYREQVRVASYLCDFVLPGLGLVLECDGAYWHSLWDRPRSEGARDARVAAAGFRVVRLGEVELGQDPVGAVLRALDPGREADAD